VEARVHTCLGNLSNEEVHGSMDRAEEIRDYKSAHILLKSKVAREKENRKDN